MFELLLSSGVIKLDDEQEEIDTAMFMKKPLNGISCASCEKNIKKLSSKAGNFTAWKKLPQRDPLDRLPNSG